MKKFIIGHEEPDTDSVVSAIGLAELKKSLGENYEPVIAEEVNKETGFVLKKFKITCPQKAKKTKAEFILVDHNEPTQMSKVVEVQSITAIFDHHQLGGLETPNPIKVLIKPVGSTSTIITQMFREKNIKPSIKIASILLSGMISDTLNFNSPTTIQEDKNAAIFLNRIAKINIDKLAQEMFEAKSDLTGMSINKIIVADYKVFKVGSSKIGIGVYETVRPESAFKIKEKLIAGLNKLKDKNKLDLIYFVVVDVINHRSQMFIISKEEQKVAEKVFGGKTKESILSLGRRVSRKKEIVPPLEKFFE